ncbi:HNH endonuclease [Sphingomonas cannabina]|uniref:HNH endonuclease n=1 Tax=Sphingomonas cannabina TaxID=2899123 RepID=UPI001F299AB7|nr:HNH endonuclease signature motif containing protein [Sphingomonas cannabina]UIJ43713.1 HNH endonuclease [Sphingomonas cannabina]
MRARILIEEPLCRLCLEAGRISPTTIADHIIPKAEGGGDERSNYQGLCRPCHVAKTARESARARRRR